MKYFPIFADLDKAHVLVVGGGEQAAQKVRLLRKTRAQHHRRRRDRHRRAARARGGERDLDRAARIPGARPRRPAPRLCGDRRPRARRRGVARRQGQGHPRQRRRCAGALHLHHAGYRRPRAGDGGDRHRGRRPDPGARDQDPARGAAARQLRQAGRACAGACAALVAKAVPDARARRRLWERLLQGPFRRAVLARRGGRGRAHPRRRAPWRGCAGRRSVAGPRGADRLRPRRSRPAHAEGAAALQEADVLVVDRLVNPQDPRVRAPRCRAHLRRQDPARAHHVAGRDQPHPGARGPGRQGRGPAQGRRSLHLRPRRRGDGGAAGGRHRRRGGARRDGGARLRGPHRPAGDAARACAAASRSSPAPPPTACPISTGRRWPRPARRSPSTWASATRRSCAPTCWPPAPIPDTPVVIVENGTREDERAFATTLADLTDCVAAARDRRSRRHLRRPRLGRRRPLSPRERDRASPPTPVRAGSRACRASPPPTPRSTP